jgi:hypothetical protein
LLRFLHLMQIDTGVRLHSLLRLRLNFLALLRWKRHISVTFATYKSFIHGSIAIAYEIRLSNSRNTYFLVGGKVMALIPIT